MKKFAILFCLLFYIITFVAAQNIACIRINQLGYSSSGLKIAVLGSDKPVASSKFFITNEKNKVFTARISRDFGRYGPFLHTYRINFFPGEYIHPINYSQCDKISCPLVVNSKCVCH